MDIESSGCNTLLALKMSRSKSPPLASSAIQPSPETVTTPTTKEATQEALDDGPSKNGARLDSTVGPVKKKRGSAVGSGGDKKKKAGRACATCQKAHLTCDDGRPCMRCIKKGCPEKCVDGVRKKAKYLLEVPDELLDRRNVNSLSTPTEQQLPQAQPQGETPKENQQPIDNWTFDSLNYFDTNDFPLDSSSQVQNFNLGVPLIDPGNSTQDVGFGSAAANLEYAVLSRMLGGYGSPQDQPNSVVMPPQRPKEENFTNDILNSPLVDTNGTNGFSPHLLQSPMPNPASLLTAEEAYLSVQKPYPYAQSYHYLVRHLKDRFERDDILRIVRALAKFRPSLIALQMPLSEEDETFVERTFQRTLVELNKLISFSGTPTVVWRRTGEICLVGAEFCLLTGWSRESLIGKKFIFELFDTTSVVEYYERFAEHAFESSTGSISSQCVVVGPRGNLVPCAFCFSVRRDLFSCPFLIIGSFLPVLV